MNDATKTEQKPIKDRLAALEKEMHEASSATNKELRVLRRILGEQRDMLLLTEADVARDRLRAMSDRMLEMDRRQQAMILRFTVATEVLFLARHSYQSAAMSIAPIVIQAFDNPDAWWTERIDLTLGQWDQELRRWHNSKELAA